MRMQLVVVFEVVFVSLWVVDGGGGGHGSLTTCVLVLDAVSIGWMLCRPGVRSTWSQTERVVFLTLSADRVGSGFLHVKSTETNCFHVESMSLRVWLAGRER
jgi:hypothetical protein